MISDVTCVWSAGVHGGAERKAAGGGKRHEVLQAQERSQAADLPEQETLYKYDIHTAMFRPEICHPGHLKDSYRTTGCERDLPFQAVSKTGVICGY